MNRLTAKKEPQATIAEPSGEIDREVLRRAFGSSSLDFANALLGQVESFSSAPSSGQTGSNSFSTEVVFGIEPQDQLEAMLAVQMSAVHLASVKVAANLSRAVSSREIDVAEKALNRLARTYALQMDTLKRYRSSGQQVVVKHVTVNDGGQAIVGDVTTGGGKQ